MAVRESCLQVDGVDDDEDIGDNCDYDDDDDDDDDYNDDEDDDDDRDDESRPGIRACVAGRV